jgi:hypothetical protein
MEHARASSSPTRGGHRQHRERVFVWVGATPFAHTAPRAAAAKHGSGSTASGGGQRGEGVAARAGRAECAARDSWPGRAESVGGWVQAMGDGQESVLLNGLCGWVQAMGDVSPREAFAQRVIAQGRALLRRTQPRPRAHDTRRPATPRILPAAAPLAADLALADSAAAGGARGERGGSADRAAGGGRDAGLVRAAEARVRALRAELAQAQQVRPQAPATHPRE